MNRLQGVVDVETSNNASAWNTPDDHMQQHSNTPACPSFPERTKPQLDVYFDNNEYSIRYAHQEVAYAAARVLYTDAGAALTASIDAYNIQHVVCDTQYRDLKTELGAAFKAPRVQGDMNGRIENYKAGETLLHQIKFLLAEVADQGAPAIATSRYELDFPVLPPKACAI